MDQVEPRFLSKIILLQSTLHVMPEDGTMSAFICRGLSELPGIYSLSIILRETYHAENSNMDLDPQLCQRLYNLLANRVESHPYDNSNILDFEKTNHVKCLKIETNLDIYGLLFIRLSDHVAFESYKPYIENTLNLTALIIENNQQKELMLDNKAHLEKMVHERTVKLKKTIDQLQVEIAERKKTAKELSESKYFIQQIVETTPNLIYIYELVNRKIIFSNREITDILGYSKSEIKSMGTHILRQIVHHEDLDKIEDHQQHMAASKEEDILEISCRVKHADGSWRWLHSRHVPFSYSPTGEVRQILGIASDITEKKRAEEVRKKLEAQLRHTQKMEAIGTISGGIAHDFNNILGIITGNTELALEKTLDWNPIYNHLKAVRTSSLRAKEVVRQLLTFSRKTERTKKPVLLTPIVKESVRLMRSSIPSTVNIALHVPNNSVIINADPTQIHQVLINLCTNAAHSMEESGGLLKITLLEMELDKGRGFGDHALKPGRYVQLSVKDTGHGIEPDIKAKIFDPYFTTKQVGKGSGMGLAMVHGIVKSHNGDISVHSESGKGALFEILFPVSKQEPAEEKTTKELPKGSAKILFVDDEEGMVQVIRTMLLRLGYQVEGMTDPNGALDLFRSDPSCFDLVITDMTMPQMTGDRLIQEIRTLRQDVPVILCTGFSERIDKEVAHKMGIQKYLEKPVNMQELAQAIQEVLRVR